MGAVKINISVSDITTVLLSFNVIRVYKSVTGEVGPYFMITAGAPVAATLTSPNEQNFNVVGKTLTVQVDSFDPVDVLFTGTAPLTAAKNRRNRARSSEKAHEHQPVAKWQFSGSARACNLNGAPLT